VYNLFDSSLNLFQANKTKVEKDKIKIESLDSSELDRLIEEKNGKQLREDVELIKGVYDEFDRTEYKKGELAPVFFGSALNNFGVKELLDTFVRISPKPQDRSTDKGFVHPEDDNFSGFIFKIHANIDP